MPPFGEWARRLWYLVNRRRFEDALRNEMDAHRERMQRPAKFGNVLKLREEARDAWGWKWLDDLGRDVRLSSRTLRRSPMFTVTSVLILSLAIGVNLAMFQMVNAALLRPLPLRDLSTLVRFDHRAPTFSSNGVPYPMAAFVDTHNTVLSAVMMRHRVEVAWGDLGEQRIDAAFVSANWFDELGASAARGRLLGHVDAASDAGAAVVVSYDFWMRQLAGRPDVAGSTIRVNDQVATVVGVAGMNFPDVGLDLPSIWMPIAQAGQFIPGSRVGIDWTTGVEMFARVRPGISLETVRASLRTVLAGLREQEPTHVAADEWLEPAPGTARFLSARSAADLIVVAATSGRDAGA